MDRLVLWDIDHTLLFAGGLGRDIFATAFTTLTGRPMRGMPPMPGRTDHGLVVDVLVGHGISPTPDLVGRFFAELEAATGRVTGEIVARGAAMPGARAALLALAAVPGVVQSVATGNLPGTARLKLTLFDLAGPLDLDIGGYGSDDGFRAALVRLARRRARDKYGVDLPPDRVWVIGDTVHDVTGAREAGVRSVGVCTGPAGAADLAAAGADLVLPDLRDHARLVAGVCGGADLVV